MPKNNEHSFDQIEKLENEHTRLFPLGSRMAEALKREIEQLIEKNNVTLGVALETRVKLWDSIKDKINRKSISMDSIRDLDDFIGLRIIVLFQKDIDTVRSFLHSSLSVIKDESTSDRLDTNQFGYLSEHLIIKIPENWLSIPSYSDFKDIKIEIQLRTLAQHIWAVASHKLQYKREESVPLPIRRTIHRASALLETVDLEFTRVLSERETYLNSTQIASKNLTLNVDLISKILTENFPYENKGKIEYFDEILLELQGLNINTQNEFSDIIKRYKAYALASDRQAVNDIKNGNHAYKFDKKRISEGVFFTFTGLVRIILKKEFGEDKFLETQIAVGTRKI